MLHQDNVQGAAPPGACGPDRTRVRALTEDPGSIGLTVPYVRPRRVARLNGKKNTGVTT
ncbi:hypothetical protein ACVW19_002532 [Streptomyces sp. TE5632]